MSSTWSHAGCCAAAAAAELCKSDCFCYNVSEIKVRLTCVCLDVESVFRQKQRLIQNSQQNWKAVQTVSCRFEPLKDDLEHLLCTI